MTFVNLYTYTPVNSSGEQFLPRDVAIYVTLCINFFYTLLRKTLLIAASLSLFATDATTKVSKWFSQNHERQPRFTSPSHVSPLYFSVEFSRAVFSLLFLSQFLSLVRFRLVRSPTRIFRPPISFGTFPACIFAAAQRQRFTASQTNEARSLLYLLLDSRAAPLFSRATINLRD